MPLVRVPAARPLLQSFNRRQHNQPELSQQKDSQQQYIQIQSKDINSVKQQKSPNRTQKHSSIILENSSVHVLKGQQTQSKQHSLDVENEHSHSSGSLHKRNRNVIYKSNEYIEMRNTFKKLDDSDHCESNPTFANHSHCFEQRPVETKVSIIHISSSNVLTENNNVEDNFPKIQIRTKSNPELNMRRTACSIPSFLYKQMSDNKSESTEVFLRDTYVPTSSNIPQCSRSQNNCKKAD